MDDLDALLADLQNSVPGNQHPLPSGATTRTVTQQHHHVQQEPYFGASTGYGSLKNREGSQSPTYQDIYATIGPPTSQQSNTLNSANGRTTYNYPQPYQTQGSLQRSGYNNSTYQNQPNNSYNSKNGLSELDSLLQDLSDARYHNVDKKRDVPLPPIPTSGMSTNYNTINSNYSNRTMDGRPAVDSLVDEMDNLNIYAVPNVPNGAGHKSPTPGRHVTITVRETKTEKLAGPQGPVGSIEENIVQQRDTFVPNNASNEMYSSAATKELDDLMASLSDFKVNNGSHHLQQVTDYAKPNQGISHLTKTITETTVVEDTEPPNNAAGDQLESMLGSLQAKMSQTSNSAAQKGRCNACEKPIVGQVISALGKTWHPEHFTCNHCSQELGTRNFFERDGFPYCETDYHNLFSPRCAYCNGAILDKCVTALEKTWHTEHFFCAQCGQQFGEDGFHERDGKPYCRNDYFEMFAPKCNGCNRAIMENYISALNSQWHPDCFVCRDCRQPFHGGSFFDHEGLPYCETHYHAKRGSLCAGCSKPITGRCITAMFRKFHPEHFVCAFCLKQLNKGTFKEQNDKPYCHGCFEKIFG